MKLYKVWKKGKIVLTPFPGRYAGIKTVKIFGRLDCKSGMRAKKENRIFFYFWEDAIKAGYRPCKKCKPEKIFKKRDCNHTFNNRIAVAVKKGKNKFKVYCALCDKFLGYAQKDSKGRIKWKDGFIDLIA